MLQSQNESPLRQGPSSGNRRQAAPRPPIGSGLFGEKSGEAARDERRL